MKGDEKTVIAIKSEIFIGTPQTLREANIIQDENGGLAADPYNISARWRNLLCHLLTVLGVKEFMGKNTYSKVTSA
jgi:hypothetical protein